MGKKITISEGFLQKYIASKVNEAVIASGQDEISVHPKGSNLTDSDIKRIGSKVNGADMSVRVDQMAGNSSYKPQPGSNHDGVSVTASEDVPGSTDKAIKAAKANGQSEITVKDSDGDKVTECFVITKDELMEIAKRGARLVSESRKKK